MIIKFIYIAFLIALVLGTVKLTRELLKKFNINRWLVGASAFLILIIPSILIKNINLVVWNGLLLIFCVLCIMFFEISSIKLHKDEIKDIINNKK